MLLKNIQENFPFLSVVQYGGNEYVGIIINQDQWVTSMYVYTDIKDEHQEQEFLQLGETWWWESNRMIPINIFLKKDLEKFTNVAGKTGIYIQYAQVRANKLISTLNVGEQSISETSSKLDSLDRKLIIALANIEFYLELSVKNSEPHHLANYLYEISNAFNAFYQASNIKNIEDKIKKNQKILVTGLFIKYSHLVMSCLGIKPVEKM